jgi:putative colanic acid biosynthesis glycosyltransferase
MLTIITINKNNVVGLNETIRSLRQLPRESYQWVFIDSLSTDGSVRIAKEFSMPNDVVISEADSGIYNAMNKGVKHSVGQFLMFLNSGDKLASGISKLQLDVEANMDVALYGFKIRNQLRRPRSNVWRFWSLPTSHQAILYSRNLLISYPFDESYLFAADFEHYLRINRLEKLRVAHSSELLIINEPYGSDMSLGRVLDEYRRALIENGYPLIWANLVHFVKRHYLKRALRL